MKSSSGSTTSNTANTNSKQPKLRINKLGIVSHDYNAYEGFNDRFDDILRILDDKGCYSVLFSLYTINKQKNFNVKILESLAKITSVFVEEFINGENKSEYIIYYKTPNCWEEYRFKQKFGKSNEISTDKEAQCFLKEVEHRIFGNCAVLLCGETNIVKYSKEDKEIYDKFNFLDTIPSEVTVILNPIHDRMTRFEMIKKRKFLSRNGRWVVSVWNKGKLYGENKKKRDGKKPAWTVFHNKEEVTIENISDQPDIEIGIVNIINM